MFTHHFPIDSLRQHIVSPDRFRPWPTIDDRARWLAVSDATRTKWITRGSYRLGFAWPALLATNYLRFMRDGDRKNYEGPYFARRSTLVDLVLAECFEDKGRFLDDIANGIWTICEETTWVVPAHSNDLHGDYGPPDAAGTWVDLFASETAMILAWTHYLLGSRLAKVSGCVDVRLIKEIRRRVLDPLMQRDDMGWMGLSHNDPVNNWNPWIISNWLACLLILEEDREKRIAGIEKCVRSLGRFVDGYPRDGGCDEGPMYWTRAGGSLFDCLDLLYQASEGKLSLYQDDHIKEIGRFVHRAHVSGPYVLNFADALAVMYSDPTLVYWYGKRIGDREMMSFGRWLRVQLGLEDRGVWDRSMGRTLRTVFCEEELREGGAGQPPMVRDVFLSDIQVFVARDRAGTDAGFFVAAKGGHNAESHNHNDVGNFVVYLDGKPLLIDMGVETYTRKTFGPERYEIWTMPSGFHNLPTIGSVQQKDGRSYAARDVRHHVSDASASLTLDIAGAYPAQAGLTKWIRTVELTRGKRVTVTDRYELSAEVPTLTWSLITPCTVRSTSPGTLELARADLSGGRQSSQGIVRYAPIGLQVDVAEHEITDAQLAASWGKRLCRVRLKLDNPGRAGEVTTVVSAD
jgi:hypothetical protein